MLARWRSRARGDLGVTLVETLVAVIILGIAGAAVTAGVRMGVTASDINRKQTTSGSYVRSWAEAIQKYVSLADANYQRCAAADAYKPSTVGFTMPAGYTAVQAPATTLDGAGAPVTTGTCPGRDIGVQRVLLTIRSNDTRASEQLSIVLRRSCEGTACLVP